jgi:hypothetical protein
MAAGRYRGSPLVESTMPLRTTLAFLIAALWTTSLLPAQAPGGDVQNILDTYRRLRPADKDLAIFQLDWVPTLKEATQRAAKQRRPILLLVVTNSYGNLFTGHC